MSKKSMWSVKFSTASLVLIPAAVGINYIGKLFAGVLKLPLWLDSIGTMLASMLAGPVIGALSGAINNIIYGLTMDPISFVYAVTSIAIGITIGILAYKGLIKNILSAVLCGIIAAFVAAVVSTPINIAFWGGQTGNIWGDGLFAILVAKKFPLWIASFLDELVVDIPDKAATLIVSYIIFKGLPKSLTNLYDNKNEIEQL
ncbi:energy-coupling factor transport system substrate-specific component [Caloramator quimbayensis]|uniref:Energy-coupling factor transport system substrate-specific component n=1 Tax=Caloramator quimbayensis TaxID=1147123 RepID=A0A1T4XGX2_9CLOT|nr:ECF transporter S component [Caloramator quimbayensis]SKA88743.1 energy-coupling factor transport system substrate-specific component [Caloramator quimbayensis]